MKSPIEHIIVLMLENRSFNHLFAYSAIPGLQGVDTSMSNPQPNGPQVSMANTAPDVSIGDAGHEFEDVQEQMYWTPAAARSPTIAMEGFVKSSGPEAMLCVDPSRLPVLTQLARHFLVCDHWFSSMPGPTWPNRFFVHAGSSGGLANSPSNLTSIGSVLWSTLGFSFDNGTVFEALERAGKSWRIYHGDHFPQVCAIDTMPSIFVGGSRRFRSFNKFAKDVAGGDVASYTFIEPNYDIFSKFRNGNSQHPTGALSAGEGLIRAVYQAVSTNRAVWTKSLLFVLYDEHGGYYDQEPPPRCISPGDSPRNAGKAAHPPNPPFAFDLYGVRVPAVVVSPLLKPNSVSHETYDHTSVIRTIYDVFALSGQLTSRDGSAKSLAPLLQGVPTSVAPPILPDPHIPPTWVMVSPAPRTPPSRSIDGFTRIAAQIEHALNTYDPLRPNSTFQEVLRATPDIRTTMELPSSADPTESLAYLQKVATKIDAHRVAQGEGPVR